MICNMSASLVMQVLALLAGIAAASAARVVCPVNSQTLLTGDATLLNRQTGIEGSSADSRNPAENFVVSTLSWCSAENTINASAEYVEVTFSELIVATILVSGGKQTGYVKNFTIQYAAELADPLQPYGVLKPVQDFYVANIAASDAYFALESPILARRLRFSIIDGMMDPFVRICWSMMVYGCRATDSRMAGEDSTIASASVTSSSPTEPASASTEQVPSTSTGPSVVVDPGSSVGCDVKQGTISQKDLLLVVIPSVVVLIVVVLIAVTSGIIICLCLSKSPQGESSPMYESVKVKILNKRTKDLVGNGSTGPQGVYDQPRPQFYDVPKSMHSPSPFRSSTSSLGSNMEVKNPVYLEKKNLQEMNIALQQLPADDGNDYEDVMEALPKRHGHERQTLANAAYSSSFYRPPLPPTPPITTTAGGNLPNNELAASAAARLPLAEPQSAVTRTTSLDGGEAVPKYSKVNKEKSSEEGRAERGRSSSPVIKSHYMSTNAAITEELNRLTSELESTLISQS